MFADILRCTRDERCDCRLGCARVLREQCRAGARCDCRGHARDVLRRSGREIAHVVTGRLRTLDVWHRHITACCVACRAEPVGILGVLHRSEVEPGRLLQGRLDRRLKRKAAADGVVQASLERRANLGTQTRRGEMAVGIVERLREGLIGLCEIIALLVG